MFGGSVGLGVGGKIWTCDLISIVLKVNSCEIENESCLKTLEIRSNYLEDRFDLEIEFTFKTMEIRSKIHFFLPTPNPTPPPNIGPHFNSKVVGLLVGGKFWTFDLISIVFKHDSFSRSNLSSRWFDLISNVFNRDSFMKWIWYLNWSKVQCLAVVLDWVWGEKFELVI